MITVKEMTYLLVLLVVYWAFHFVHYDSGSIIVKSSLQHHTKELVSYKDILAQKAINGTVFLMMTDYGYMDMFVNNYQVGNLSQYKNLVVLCIDKRSYQVWVMEGSEW